VLDPQLRLSRLFAAASQVAMAFLVAQTAGVAAAGLQIFICYRREEARHAARLLAQAIEQRLPETQIFIDVDRRAIAVGENWKTKIEAAIDASDVLIALIGDRWLEIRDSEGARRLDNPDDALRLELKRALDRNILVIPALLDEARMPRADQLPPLISELVWRRGVELRHSRWDDDVGELIEELESQRQTLEQERTAREAAAQAERERVAREAAEQASREQAEREAAEREAAEQAARDHAGQEAAERQATERAKQTAAERAEREALERERAERQAAERDAAERAAAEQATREQAEQRAADREATEQAAREQAEREAGERQATERAKQIAAERAEREALERERAERQAAERDAAQREAAAREAAEQAAREQAERNILSAARPRGKAAAADAAPSARAGATAALREAKEPGASAIKEPTQRTLRSIQAVVLVVGVLLLLALFIPAYKSEIGEFFTVYAVRWFFDDPGRALASPWSAVWWEQGLYWNALALLLLPLGMVVFAVRVRSFASSRRALGFVASIGLASFVHALSQAVVPLTASAAYYFEPRLLVGAYVELIGTAIVAVGGLILIAKFGRSRRSVSPNHDPGQLSGALALAAVAGAILAAVAAFVSFAKHGAVGLYSFRAADSRGGPALADGPGVVLVPPLFIAASTLLAVVLARWQRLETGFAQGAIAGLAVYALLYYVGLLGTVIAASSWSAVRGAPFLGIMGATLVLVALLRERDRSGVFARFHRKL
jgi:hypothetical protein